MAINRKTIESLIRHLLLALAGAAAVVLRTLAVFRDLNTETGYYEAKQLIDAAEIVAWSAVIFFLVYGLLTRRNLRLIASFGSPATFVPTGATSAAMVFFAVDLFTMSRDFTSEKQRTPFVLLLVAAVFSLGAVVYFFLNAYYRRAHIALRANFGLFAVLALTAYAVYLYFDPAYPLNAPNKITSQMGLLFTALFLLFETRISLGRERWNAYIAFGDAAAILTAYASIPGLVVYFVRGEMIASTLSELILLLVLFFFILSRLILVGTLKEDRKCDFITRLTEVSDEREYDVYLTEEHATAYFKTHPRVDCYKDPEAEEAEIKEEAPVQETEEEVPAEAPEIEVPAEEVSAPEAEGTAPENAPENEEKTEDAEAPEAEAPAEEKEPEEKAEEEPMLRFAIRKPTKKGRITEDEQDLGD